MAVAPAFDEARRMQPHEARVAEKLDACLLERGIERGVEGFARSGKSLWLMVSVGISAASARSSPCACCTLEMTVTISAG